MRNSTLPPVQLPEPKLCLRPIAEEEIIQQAHRNRTRMQERDPARRRAMLKDLQRITDDPAKLKAYLLKSSMIDGLRRAAATA